MNINKKQITVVLLVIIGVFALIIFLVVRNSNQYLSRMPIFFFNVSEGQFVPESRPWPTNVTREVWVETAMSYMMDNPGRGGLTSVWPSNIPKEQLIENFYFHCQCDDYEDCGECYNGVCYFCPNILIIEFSELYNEIPPLDEALFRSALTLTMTNFNFVDSVIFKTPTNERVESISTISTEPLSPIRLSSATFNLYFMHESGAGLVREVRTVQSSDAQRRSEAILKELIRGPNSPGLVALIPPETQVHFTRLETGINTIYVALSSDFVSRFNGNTHQARMMIYSITHTVLNDISAQGVWQVVFLVDWLRHDEFHGVSDFSSPFMTSERNMLDFVDTELYDEQNGYNGDYYGDYGEYE